MTWRERIFPPWQQLRRLFFVSWLVHYVFYRPNCILCYFQAQAEERATMLRAQLEQRKKAILERINKEGKDKLEKVWKT